jgi:hypothetical protein
MKAGQEVMETKLENTEVSHDKLQAKAEIWLEKREADHEESEANQQPGPKRKSHAPACCPAGLGFRCTRNP